MQTAKLIQQGENQVLQLPEGFHFSGDEVVIRRIGEMVYLYQKEMAEDIFLSSLGNFTDDYLEAVEESVNERRNRYKS